MSHPKFIAEKIFNCDDISKFSKFVIRLLPYKGVSMSRFYLCEYANVQFLTKLSLYTKTFYELSNLEEKENVVPSAQSIVPHTTAEIEILKILKAEIIDKNLSPGILELIYVKTCDGVTKFPQVSDTNCAKYLYSVSREPLDDISSLLCSYAELIRANLAFDKISLIVLDKCDATLGEYLYRLTDSPINRAIFKSLLFQIIHTMYVINAKYPKFRHGDLHTSNVMLKFDTNYTFNATAPKFLVYNLPNLTKLYIPYFGIIMKLIDFGYSSLPEHNIISTAMQDPHIVFDRSTNDLLFLYHGINFICNATKNEYIPTILEQLEPNKTYMRYQTAHIRKLDSKNLIPTYLDMVTNKIWLEYNLDQSTITPKYMFAEFDAC